MTRPKTTSTTGRGKASRTLDRVSFGKRLRATRQAQGLTLLEVAARSGVSITTISRAERGQLTLSYEKFSALGRALAMDMAAMFSPADARTSGLDRPVLTRAGAGVTYQGEAFSYEFLGTDVVGKQMSPILGLVHARRFNGPQDYVRHEGEEFAYVLAGAIEVYFESGEVMRLVRGDSLYFDSRIGHAYISVSRQLARIVGACTSESSPARQARAEAAEPVAKAPRAARTPRPAKR